MTLTPIIRRKLRQIAGGRNNLPVLIDKFDTTKAPVVVGHGFFYATKGGSVIYHPSAYSKKGWSNMIYHCSTIHVEVGIEWLKENLTMNEITEIVLETLCSKK